MVDPADDLHHHGDEEPCCADELPVPAWSRRLVHRRGAGSAFVRARPVTASSAILESAVLCLREGRILSGLGHTIAGMALPPRTALSCGHDYSAHGSTAAIRVARISEASPTNHIVSFRSLSVGDRTLQVQRCSTCRQIQGYTLRCRWTFVDTDARCSTGTRAGQTRTGRP